ncbi:polysaccharide pyruvyl transferase family protein, partial [uncultured Corynebacterium sp.]|uniref:polysaccharide pyruvyl transferase family protein n=1 Tax=uncultured Corynebacterium sp. TaxID=159447 RepID=UPI002616F93A
MTQQLIYLVAPTGFPNFGDEYIAAAWLRTLARRRPGARVVLDCPNPGSAAVLHAGRHPNLTVTDTLFRVLERAREDAGTEWEGVVARAEDIMRTPHELVRFEAGIRLARAADVVHLLGGGWINDLNPEFAGVAAAASLAGCDAPGGALRAATGQGLAPGAAGTGRLGAVWRRFDVVDVRDDDSFALVDGLPAETNRGVDDAWVALTGGAAGDG